MKKTTEKQVLVSTLEKENCTIKEMIQEIYLLTGMRISTFQAMCLVGKSKGIENLFFSLLKTEEGKKYLNQLQMIREGAR